MLELSKSEEASRQQFSWTGCGGRVGGDSAPSLLGRAGRGLATASVVPVPGTSRGPPACSRQVSIGGGHAIEPDNEQPSRRLGPYGRRGQAGGRGNGEKQRSQWNRRATARSNQRGAGGAVLLCLRMALKALIGRLLRGLGCFGPGGVCMGCTSQFPCWLARDPFFASFLSPSLLVSVLLCPRRPPRASLVPTSTPVMEGGWMGSLISVLAECLSHPFLGVSHCTHCLHRPQAPNYSPLGCSAHCPHRGRLFVLLLDPDQIRCSPFGVETAQPIHFWHSALSSLQPIVTPQPSQHDHEPCLHDAASPHQPGTRNLRPPMTD